ncbi:MAG TPA: LysR substrate-binding domain-containing protein [Eoetvoesiella sp.]
MTKKRKLPPLPAVRSFEAAARHRSFTLAAEELHVTQGAVSLQVRKLEEYLGKKLFVRMIRQVDLTDEGIEYYAACRNMLEDLEKATERIVNRDQHATLTVSTIPTISMLWLMPRLASFASLHRDIEVRVVSDIRAVDMVRDGIDVAIRVGKLPGQQYSSSQPGVDLVMLKRWDGIQADFLFDDVLVPVMSKKLQDHKRQITSVQDLLDYTLIHTASRPNAWRDWLRAYGVSLSSKPVEMECGHFYISLLAAQEGKGIAIIPKVLLDGYPGRNELIAPLEQLDPIKSAGEYYLLTHEAELQRPAVGLFRKWILSVAKQPRY